ncbi:alpha-N-acetylgalactosaminide alpha-2,6-sialyltransferase 6 isoform X2 [Hippocampus comes]|uniref:alpha-N-acetylgalactosaminide alpha-2,6-sialyltransferase 6 isoform X2 n=1 Tax=Hippocampus comes TaxID=109280 RepID=UPI00094E6316|nr:PREDICTED: alpha-N-acetylgalactosaminide alpha-2,6-sialyltransferase 6 isoform X2 [Hippocampus comes]XP_019727757.1 PREDICTED: alpha-N-acetylgalactosaminide alpha-2,6-sialyltransferase 6 isoform X2 [Hippocampus comes]
MIGEAGTHTWRVTIAAAIFILMTLFILYSSSSGSIASISQAAYTPFQIAKNHTPKPTNLKKWATKDDYVPVYGDKRMTQRCHHCALVSSSSHVLGTQAGEEIDSSECVIRMNDAPTTGYEADVGKRTTLRVVAHSSLYRVVRRPNEFMVVGAESQRTIIFWGPPNKMTKDSKATVYRAIQRISSTYKEVPCFTVAPEKMRRFDKLFQLETGRDRQKSNSWLSTGWFTMVIAIEICDNIKVYGMVPPSYCGNRTGSKKLPYHYYNPRGSDECMTYIQNQNNQKGGHHRFITEKQVFGHWAHQYNITFAHPTW